MLDKSINFFYIALSSRWVLDIAFRFVPVDDLLLNLGLLVRVVSPLIFGFD